MPAPDDDAKYIINSVDRALRVLEYLTATRGPQEISVISEATDLPRTSLVRLLVTLERRGFVLHSGDGYRLGHKVLHMGLTVRSEMKLLDIAVPEMRQLHHKHPESTINLAILQRGKAICVEQILTTNAAKVVGWLENPLHCTALGKVLLAFRPPAQAQEILASLNLSPRTPKTITDRDRLRNEIQMIRERGIAYDDAESERWVRCVAAPILDHSGQAVASLSLSLLATALDVVKGRPTEDLRSAALVLSTAFGGREHL